MSYVTWTGNVHTTSRDTTRGHMPMQTVDRQIWASPLTLGHPPRYLPFGHVEKILIAVKFACVFIFERTLFAVALGCHTLSLLHLIFCRFAFWFVFLCCVACLALCFSAFGFLFVSVPTVAHMNSCATKGFYSKIPAKTSQQNRSPIKKTHGVF